MSEPPVWGESASGAGVDADAPDDATAPAARTHRSHRAPRRGLREQLQTRWMLLGLVLVALLIAFTVLFGSDDSGESGDGGEQAARSAPTSEPAPTPSESVVSDPTTKATTTTPKPTDTGDDEQPGDGGDGEKKSAAPAKAPVLVLNNSRITGLAARWASTIRDEDWTVTRTDNWTRSDLARTTVFYAEGDKAAALAFKKEFGVVRDVRPALSGMGPDLTLVLTSAAN